MNFKVLLLFFPLLCLSQNKTTLKVLDDGLKPISRALVVITENEKQVAFGTTNEEGILEKILSNGIYDIKASKLGFTAFTKNVRVESESEIVFILENEINNLETVIIKSRPNVMKIKEDTISYNIKAITDGTENKVEDLIKKLPGLNVDESGKVSYKGQQIDKVLIDGNEFFNNKHQMATQNIDANMIEGIDLLLNHSGFSNASNSEKSTALNLKTKDSFKNKWIGEADLAKGTKNALKLHNNLFKFFKDGNIAIIADYNTIAKTPISIEDYNEMQSVSAVTFEDQKVTQAEMPSFLNPNSFFTEKENSFIGVHFTSKFSDKAKITLSNIFNNASILESQFKNQSNIGEGNSVQSFSDIKNATAILNNTSVKWEYNKSKKTYISYFAGLTPNFDNETSTLTRLGNTIEYEKKQNNTGFSQQFHVLTRIFEKINYKFYFKHRYQLQNQKQFLENTEPLFNFNFTRINQDLNAKNNDINIVNEFSMVQKTSLFSMKINFLSLNSAFISSIGQNTNFQNNLELNRQMIVAYPSWLKNWTTKFQSTFGAKLSYSKIDFTSNKDTFFRLEPVINLVYNIGLLHKVSFNYTMNHDLPTVNDLQNESTIFDFQTLFKRSAVAFNEIIPRSDFSLDYLKISSKTQSVFFSRINYSRIQNAIATNSSYQTNYAENNFITTEKNEQLNAIVYFDLKFKNVPFSIKNTAAYFNTLGISQFDGLNNNLKTSIFSGKSQLTSNIKNSNVQIDLGINLRQTQFSQSINSFSNKTVNTQTSLNVRGKLKTFLKWNVEIKRDFQNSALSKNKIDFLNANIQCRVSKNLRLNVNGFNLLNLENSQIISTSLNEVFFTETVTQIMPGYIIAGIIFSY